MKRVLAAVAILALGAACRDSALASGRGRSAEKALCAAAHGIPHVLLAYHQDRISGKRAMQRLSGVRKVIEDNATGAYGAHLRDVAAALHVFEVVTVHHGDTNDAYRDLRTLREALPRARCAKATSPSKER